MLNIPIFNESYQRLAHKKGKTINTQEARTALEDEFNFSIVENSPVKVLTDEVSTSYVLLIERTVEENLKFENLIINIKEDEMIASIMKYTLSEKATYLELHEAYDMDVIDVQISILTNDNKESCTSVFIPYCNNTSGGQPAGHFAFSDGCSTSGFYEYVNCSEGGGGGGFEGSGGNNGGTPPTGTGNTGGGGGNVDGVSNPVINTIPIVNQNNITILPSKKYIKNLIITDSARYQCFNNSPNDFKTSLENYLNTNGLIDVSVDDEISTTEQFANAAIDAQCSGGEVDFDNKIILDSTFVNNQKAMCIYNKMRSIKAFNKSLEPFEIGNPVAFIKLKTGILADADRAETSEPDSNNIITITINSCGTCSNGINYQPNLLLAQTITHEVLHAEFFRRIILAINNGSFIYDINLMINALENSQYSELAEYIRTTNDWSHNYMAEKFRRAIARITQEYATGIPVTGIPDAFYTSLAWRGLNNGDVNAWVALAVSTKTEINNTIANYTALNANQVCN